MWTEEEMDFETELDKTTEQYLVSIRVQVAEILKLAILRSVYQSYSPVSYTRLYQLYNQVKFEVQRNGKFTVLLAYIDTDNMYYESAVSGSDVTEQVPWFVEEGHRYRNYTPPVSVAGNMYHSYPPRRYLELAQQLIEQQLGIQVEIIKDKPAIVY